MNKFAGLFLVLLSAGAASAQTAAPSATPPPADETDVVKITTALIQLDVTVTDKSGKIITDIRPDEIEIFENGEKQPISNFSFVSNLKIGEPKAKTNKNSLVLLSPALKAENVRRSIALVVDDLTLSFESTANVRRAVKKFVDEQMQPGDLVAIIRTGAGIGALQQFTSDKRQLYAAIERIRWNPAGAGGIGAFAPLEERAGDGDIEPVQGSRTREGREREFNDFRESLYSTGTLGAINYVVRGMQDLPGRKSIMLLSDGFSLFHRDASGFADTGRVLEKLRRLIDMANRASVVVYTMDARGLLVGGLTSADDPGGRTPAELDRAMLDRRTQITDNQDGLRYLARQTGGLAIVNSNDLSSGIRKILDDQSYYLIGYEPDGATFDPGTRRFNHLEIKVTRPGTRVRYRSGFFGLSDDKLVRPVRTPAERLNLALASPFATNDISTRLNTLFYKGARTDSVIRSLLHVRGSDLKFTDEPDGRKKAMFDVVAAGFGDTGLVVEQIAQTYTIRMAKDVFAQMIQKGGFVYDFSFAIKAPGAYQLRVAIYDHGSDKIGSANQFIEVPNLKKNRLVLSGVVLENFEYAEWERRNAGKPPQPGTSEPLIATSLRQFKRGTVLNYGFNVYNSKAVAGVPNLSYQTRVFRDGQQIFETAAQLIPLNGQNQASPTVTAALALGAGMSPGEYVLQLTVIDNLANAKKNTATQFIQFDILE